MLAYEGHEVRTAYDGLEVLATGQLFEPDVILLDIGMPVMDGYQTARQIRERPWGHDVYLVALTGWGQEEDREAALGPRAFSTTSSNRRRPKKSPPFSNWRAARASAQGKNDRNRNAAKITR